MLPVNTTLEELRKRKPCQLIYDFEAVVMAKCKERYKYDDFEAYQELDNLSDRIIQVISEHMEGGVK